MRRLLRARKRQSVAPRQRKPRRQGAGPVDFHARRVERYRRLGSEFARLPPETTRKAGAALSC